MCVGGTRLDYMYGCVVAGGPRAIVQYTVL